MEIYKWEENNNQIEEGFFEMTDGFSKTKNYKIS